MANDVGKSKRNFYETKKFCHIPEHGEFIVKVAVNSEGEVFTSQCPVCKSILEQISDSKVKNISFKENKNFCEHDGHGEYIEQIIEVNNGGIITSKCPKCEAEVLKREPKLMQCKKHGEYMAHFRFTTRKNAPPGKGFLRTTCPQCAKENILGEKKAEEDNRKNTINTLLKKANIPDKFREASVANYQIECEGQEHAVFLATSYINEFQQTGKGEFNLIFYGIPGTGKTHLAISIINAIVKMGFKANYTSVLKVLSEVKGTYNSGSTITEEDIHANYAKFDLLVLDEVGVGQKRTEWEQGVLYHLINSRYEKKLPVIIITNGPKNDPKGPDPEFLIDKYLDKYLTKKVNNRIIENGCEYMQFNWVSYRERFSI